MTSPWLLSVVVTLNCVCSNKHIFDKFNCAFKSLHSTKTQQDEVTNVFVSFFFVIGDSDNSSTLLLLRQYCWLQLITLSSNAIQGWALD